ncbi:Dbl homology domain-containing protein [Phycomyces blakesleeanus]|uniref:DH domain-containing protein n=2 Tax=Phycomyces blakesleeanus TaxID=4837 RepID=A0A167R7N6_PHYB8|nr:hypothetical protein PHYBLDRAFT_161680 [Phycomyces blakesleeanus NRRL 1555(-)]OAD81044.1 hypothetical protein PHYBLDRAFT_161680 [Phycomyces blakesleeanus NRRL 1555(-)]|eukprot:XP_018299084.1 hypothetical protein PHYBLDRAFT_161680 [Phycomyces blakesleeanus NRRL 1555(-)]
MSNSPSATSSGSSESSSSFVPNFSFMTDASYQQLVDDLSIIDDLDAVYGNYIDNEAFDKQVADVARNVSFKHQSLVSFFRDESRYAKELSQFQDYYATQIQKWIDIPANRASLAKRKVPEYKEHLQMFFDGMSMMHAAHTAFISDMEARLGMWGPTQLVSDIFTSLYLRILAYKSFFDNYSQIIVMLDTLYKGPSFNKSIHACASEANQSIHPLLYYVRLPTTRSVTYSRIITQLLDYTEPSHPDYLGLVDIRHNLILLEKELHEKVNDCQSHLMVLECSRIIENCSVPVTIDRRLILRATLIKVSLENPLLVNDTRTYVLYNDSLIFCKKVKNLRKERLQCKGVLDLVGATLRPIPKSLVAQMTEARKPVLPAFFSKKLEEPQSPQIPVYGFELVVNDRNSDGPTSQNFSFAVDSLPTVNGTGVVYRRRHVVRTNTLSEQTLWIDKLVKVLQAVNSS